MGTLYGSKYTHIYRYTHVAIITRTVVYSVYSVFEPNLHPRSFVTTRYTPIFTRKMRTSN